MDEIGNKAKALYQLVELGINVPKFNVLNKDFFIQFIVESGAYEDAQLVLVKNGCIKDIFEKIREKISNNTIGNNLKFIIDKKTEDLSFPIAIRSSSVEDDRTQSCAGLFYSSLNVEKHNLYEEIKNVIFSLYNESSIMAIRNQTFHPDTYYMGVILQEMVKSDWSGVAFSVDPVTNDKDTILIEVVKGYGENLVSGMKNADIIQITKNCEIEDIYSLKPSVLTELRNILIKLEKHYGYPVDVEWSLEGDKLFILQCRPVTTFIEKKKANNYKIFDMSEMNASTYEYLAGLKGRYQQWIKKANFHKFCIENNINLYCWKFIYFSKETLSKIDFDELLSDYQSDYLYYFVNNLYVSSCYKKDFKNIVYNITQMYEDYEYCISIRECLPNELSAISQLCSDGNIQIECVSGKMTVLNNGLTVPSTYIVSPNNEIIMENVKEQELYQFDEDKMDIIKTGIHGKITLQKNMIKYIAQMTNLFYKKFNNCSVEWWIWNNKAYAADMSVLNTELNTKQGRIISSGITSGILRQLPDIDENVLESLNMFSAISVSDAEFDTNKVDYLRYIADILKEWSKEGDVILYSNLPYIFLAPFKDYVKGYVFKDASSLCHLALIIREAGIPSISLLGNDISNMVSKHVELNAIEGTIKTI